MKRYEKFNNNPVALAGYITEKLNQCVQKITEKTGNVFYHNEAEYLAVKGIILCELLEEINEEKIQN
jgi:hypothetical protein